MSVNRFGIAGRKPRAPIPGRSAEWNRRCLDRREFAVGVAEEFVEHDLDRVFRRVRAGVAHVVVLEYGVHGRTESDPLNRDARPSLRPPPQGVFIPGTLFASQRWRSDFGANCQSSQIGRPTRRVSLLPASIEGCDGAPARVLARGFT